MLQFYFLKKEEIEFKKELALAQLQIDQKQVEAIKAGPLAIRPLGGMRVHSRTARRVRSAEEARSPAQGGFRRIG